MSRGKSSREKASPAVQALDAGQALLNAHPVFSYIGLGWVRGSQSDCPPKGWLLALRNEQAHLHPQRLAAPAEWAHIMARAVLLHAMGLWQPDHGDWRAWSAACDVVTSRFANSLAVGRPPSGMALPGGLPQWDEERWYRRFCADGVPAWAQALSLTGPAGSTMQEPREWIIPGDVRGGMTWSERFALGISESVTQAMEMAAGLRRDFGPRGPAGRGNGPSPATRAARDWFISSFPLLGSMVAAFDIVEDRQICHREEISVAAVDEVTRTIYLNPAAGLDTRERRFVIAHEVLHVALRHSSRQMGRDPLLWNAACDFVINDWLIQMRVGSAPGIGLLHDVSLRGLSAEEVYDRLVKDLRRMRRLRTMAGRQADVLDRSPITGAESFTDLDEFCRSQLGKGLLLHQEQGRGLLPAGLLEEINAVLQPPIPWEVELARWFDHHFPPLETRRTWSRLSRRQSSTPAIPRPARAVDPEHRQGRTFGVVLDTSGSMDRRTLAKALGAIAGYAEAKEVPAVRVVCCDAAPYDLGYLAPTSVAGRVRLRGRGGTVLQPGVRLLEAAADFPADGPILIITDGQCDAVRISREHAFLLPPGRRLPFAHRGEVFEMR